MQATSRPSSEDDGGGTDGRGEIRISVGGGVGGSLVVGDHNQVIHDPAAAPIAGPAAGGTDDGRTSTEEAAAGGATGSCREPSGRLADAEIGELARVYCSELEARQMLIRAGFAAGRLPSWNAASSLEFWREVARLVDHGVLDRARRRILAVAHEDFPANAVLAAAWAAV